VAKLKAVSMSARAPKQLYTQVERARRDRSPWTRVQAVLAPLQFAVFLVSAALVVRYLVNGDGLFAAHASIVVKTFILYTIMVTGAIWEKDVFGQYLFAPAFFWEDVVSMAVIGFHTAYLVMLLWQLGSPITQLIVALIGYAIYVVNAAQFIWKLRAARLGAAAAAEVPACNRRSILTEAAHLLRRHRPDRSFVSGVSERFSAA